MWEGVSPSTLEKGPEVGVVPILRNFSIFELKKTNFDAFWDFCS